MMLIPANYLGTRRDDSGQPCKTRARTVPNPCPERRKIGTNFRDTFRSINGPLSRVSRVVPTEVGLRGGLRTVDNGCLGGRSAISKKDFSGFSPRDVFLEGPRILVSGASGTAKYAPKAAPVLGNAGEL